MGKWRFSVEKVVSGPSGWVGGSCPVPSGFEIGSLNPLSQANNGEGGQAGQKSNQCQKYIYIIFSPRRQSWLIRKTGKSVKKMAGVPVPLLLTARGDQRRIKSAGKRNNKHYHWNKWNQHIWCSSSTSENSIKVWTGASPCIGVSQLLLLSPAQDSSWLCYCATLELHTALFQTVTQSTAVLLCGIQLCTERCAVDQLRREPPCWGGVGEGGLARGDLDTR